MQVHKTPIIQLKMDNVRNYLISISVDTNAYIWDDANAFTTHVKFKKRHYFLKFIF